MNHDVVVPSPGESVSSGILAKWLKADGATVRAGEELFELETDKATMAVPASADGVLHRVTPEGQEVQVGDVVASISNAPSSASLPNPNRNLNPNPNLNPPLPAPPVPPGGPTSVSAAPAPAAPPQPETRNLTPPLPPPRLPPSPPPYPPAARRASA